MTNDQSIADDAMTNDREANAEDPSWSLELGHSLVIGHFIMVIHWTLVIGHWSFRHAFRPNACMPVRTSSLYMDQVPPRVGRSPPRPRSWTQPRGATSPTFCPWPNFFAVENLPPPSSNPVRAATL